MMKNFASLAFTEAVKAIQEKQGSRATYERMEKRTVVTGLTDAEIDFIGTRDSFYIASIGENKFPYIQHRGGPKGFVKVIDSTTLGFLDFSGNRQYITAGNLATHTNVSVIMMDYAAQARLKLYARAEIVALDAKPELAAKLTLHDYPYKAERIMLLHIEAYDWNCPQHITPRYTAEEIEEVMAPQRDYIKKLEQEIKDLKSK